ncbi:MAG TPA: acyl-CoA dehydratase activase-related protein [Clostridia bacterium]|nr:acyl-CoA dehydratase activase-related protein [Clostridia bacterium]
MAVKIGIPSALYYHQFYPFWKTFFNEIGVEVVTSGRTTKKILNDGVKEALADACVPVKLFFGHTIALKDKVDFLFIPRVVCMNKRTVYCPKFLGLPDMIRHSLENLPEIIDVRLDARDGTAAIFRAYYGLAKRFTSNKYRIVSAYFKAGRALADFNRLMQLGISLPDAMESVLNGKTPDYTQHDTKLRFAVLGYPYLVFDEYINVNILGKLDRLGVQAITFENLPQDELIKQKYGTNKKVFWSYSDAILRSAYYLFESKKVDGIIHTTVFGCGPDSIVDKLLEIEAKKQGDLPFTVISFDEHTGEGGTATRLEAFVDMVKRKRGVY